VIDRSLPLAQARASNTASRKAESSSTKKPPPPVAETKKIMKVRLWLRMENNKFIRGKGKVRAAIALTDLLQVMEIQQEQLAERQPHDSNPGRVMSLALKSYPR
jgi:hypothetical protein